MIFVNFFGVSIPKYKSTIKQDIKYKYVCNLKCFSL